jgi:hypothetical protein
MYPRNMVCSRYTIVNTLHKGNNNIIIIKSLYLILHLSSVTEPASLSGRVAALYQCEQGCGPAHMVARYAVFVLPVVYAYLPRSPVRCFVTRFAALSLYYWLSEIACAPVLESCSSMMGVGTSCVCRYSALIRLCCTSATKVPGTHSFTAVATLTRIVLATSCKI